MRTRTLIHGLLVTLLLLGTGLLTAATATAADNGTWGSSRLRPPAPR